MVWLARSSTCRRKNVSKGAIRRWFQSLQPTIQLELGTGNEAQDELSETIRSDQSASSVRWLRSRGRSFDYEPKESEMPSN